MAKPFHSHPQLQPGPARQPKIVHPPRIASRTAMVRDSATNMPRIVRASLPPELKQYAVQLPRPSPLPEGPRPHDRPRRTPNLRVNVPGARPPPPPPLPVKPKAAARRDPPVMPDRYYTRPDRPVPPFPQPSRVTPMMYRPNNQWGDGKVPKYGRGPNPFPPPPAEIGLQKRTQRKILEEQKGGCCTVM